MLAPGWFIYSCDEEGLAIWLVPAKGSLAMIIDKEGSARGFIVLGSWGLGVVDQKALCSDDSW